MWCNNRRKKLLVNLIFRKSDGIWWSQAKILTADQTWTFCCDTGHYFGLKISRKMRKTEKFTRFSIWSLKFSQGLRVVFLTAVRFSDGNRIGFLEWFGSVVFQRFPKIGS
jgi:hypothetical protein